MRAAPQASGLFQRSGRLLRQAECLVQKLEPTRASQIAIIGHLEFLPFIVKSAEF
ncbi:Uncharacterised protein [Klebsiella variicola]|uniref:Uncharacterized protein n=1 Tax=Klebsiella variicola TaxID=244366 RepID=A0A7H4N3L5_KLEVA|nr:Uncharacterised protein [Klebsiella variicola]